MAFLIFFLSCEKVSTPNGKMERKRVVIVALETSSEVASIALCEDNRVLAERTILSGSVYAEQIPEMLKQALADVRIDLGQVDGFAVSIGPVSYTGLRVGLSLAKGLANATGKPLVGVPTLDAVACSAPYAAFPVWVTLDARRGQVYAALYSTEAAWPEQVTPYEIGPVEELARTVKPPVLCVGSGVEAYGPIIQDCLANKALFLPFGSGRLHAVPVAFLGMRALRCGTGDSLYDLEPLYLRRPVFAKPGESS